MLKFYAIKLLDSIGQKLIWWIFFAVIFGLVSVKMFGGFAFSSIICLFAALVMIYPSLVPLQFDKLKYAHKNVGIISFSLFLNFIIAPLIAFIVGYIFLGDNIPMWIGLMLISFLPGGGMATTWALKSKADMPTVVGIIFANLMAAVFIVPAALSFMLQKLPKIEKIVENGSCAVDNATKGTLSCLSGSGDISPMKIIVPIIFIVVFPLVLAYFTQRILIKNKGVIYFERIKPMFIKISNLGLVAVLAILMGLKSNEVIFIHPEMIFSSLLPLIIFYFVQLALGLFIYKFYPNEKGRALVWGTYLRYITLALGLATSLIYQDGSLSVIIIIIILAYFIQIPSSFWLARYFARHSDAKTF